MKLPNSEGQTKKAFLYTADVTLTGSAQLVLAESQSRSSLILQNTSATDLMYIEIGCARATATLTNGTVTGVAVTNSGFGFTHPPLVRFMGGGYNGNSSYKGLNQPGGPGPNSAKGLVGRPARAHAVLTTGSVSSIVIDDPGAGYAVAPYVLLINSDLDPFGCATPSATSGIVLPAGGFPIAFNGTVTPTDSIAVFGSSNDILVCRWSD